jgi:hypothetical protein
VDDYASQLTLLIDLDNRHDDLLRRLEDLDHRVEKVLAECLAGREPVTSAGPSAPTC